MRSLSGKEGAGNRSFPTANDDPQQFKENAPTMQNEPSMSSDGAEDDLPF
ncbi:MAG: hypothetical protein HC912_03150 [Saprospiraceae bacterium]|nr:hypothetical protein [Saprospiraceae bacterium]